MLSPLDREPRRRDREECTVTSTKRLGMKLRRRGRSPLRPCLTRHMKPCSSRELTHVRDCALRTEHPVVVWAFLRSLLGSTWHHSDVRLGQSMNGAPQGLATIRNVTQGDKISFAAAQAVLSNQDSNFPDTSDCAVHKTSCRYQDFGHPTLGVLPRKHLISDLIRY